MIENRFSQRYLGAWTAAAATEAWAPSSGPTLAIGSQQGPRRRRKLNKRISRSVSQRGSATKRKETVPPLFSAQLALGACLMHGRNQRSSWRNSKCSTGPSRRGPSKNKRLLSFIYIVGLSTGRGVMIGLRVLAICLLTYAGLWVAAYRGLWYDAHVFARKSPMFEFQVGDFSVEGTVLMCLAACYS